MSKKEGQGFVWDNLAFRTSDQVGAVGRVPQSPGSLFKEVIYGTAAPQKKKKKTTVIEAACVLFTCMPEENCNTCSVGLQEHL